MVFSSSCTVYGDVQKEHVPIKESTPLAAMSPYGRTKLMIEDMMRDLAASDKEWRIILLRYFNPVGAHPSGEAAPALSCEQRCVAGERLQWPRQQTLAGGSARSTRCRVQARSASTRSASPTT